MIVKLHRKEKAMSRILERVQLKPLAKGRSDIFYPAFHEFRVLTSTGITPLVLCYSHGFMEGYQLFNPIIKHMDCKASTRQKFGYDMNVVTSGHYSEACYHLVEIVVSNIGSCKNEHSTSFELPWWRFLLCGLIVA